MIGRYYVVRRVTRRHRGSDVAAGLVLVFIGVMFVLLTFACIAAALLT